MSSANSAPSRQAVDAISGDLTYPVLFSGKSYSSRKYLMPKRNARGVTGPPSLTEADLLHRDYATAIVGFHEAVARRLGMSAAENKVLGVLSEMKIATPGQLATRAGLTTGAITGIVDRLEAAGYARREPNPADRRSLLIHSLKSAERMRTIGPIFQSLTDSMADLRARYTQAELTIVYRYLAETMEVLKRETAKLDARESRPASAKD